MKKALILMSILVAFMTILPAQITREQADAIVMKYLQNKNIEYDTLYFNIKAPSAEGITITTSNEEIFRAKYACWTYYLSENEFLRCRYLFVKESNGNLLEVIANNDLSEQDSTQWKAVEKDDPMGLVERKENTVHLLYPNPVNDVLTIPYIVEHTLVEIHDLKGVRLFSELLFGNQNYQLDVSFLSIGAYMVSIYGKTKVTYKIIKN